MNNWEIRKNYSPGFDLQGPICHKGDFHAIIIILQVAFQIVPGRMSPKYKNIDVRISQVVNQLHGHLFVLPFSP